MGHGIDQANAAAPIVGMPTRDAASTGHFGSRIFPEICLGIEAT
jgi:hypothetical protein